MATDLLSAVDYPESDGQPMGESDLHPDRMFRIIELLKLHFRGQQASRATCIFTIAKGTRGRWSAPTRWW